MNIAEYTDMKIEGYMLANDIGGHLVEEEFIMISKVMYRSNYISKVKSIIFRLQISVFGKNQIRTLKST